MDTKWNKSRQLIEMKFSITNDKHISVAATVGIQKCIPS